LKSFFEATKYALREMVPLLREPSFARRWTQPTGLRISKRGVLLLSVQEAAMIFLFLTDDTP
jgi:hypothetical protein